MSQSVKTIISKLTFLIPFGGLIFKVEFWLLFSYCDRELDMKTVFFT